MPACSWSRAYYVLPCNRLLTTFSPSIRHSSVNQVSLPTWTEACFLWFLINSLNFFNIWELTWCSMLFCKMQIQDDLHWKFCIHIFFLMSCGSVIPRFSAIWWTLSCLNVFSVSKNIVLPPSSPFSMDFPPGKAVTHRNAGFFATKFSSHLYREAWLKIELQIRHDGAMHYLLKTAIRRRKKSIH